MSEEKKTETDNKVTEYPILNFKDNDLDRLQYGIQQTLKYTDIKLAGGKGYLFWKRFLDIVISALGLILTAIPMGILCVIGFFMDFHSPIFSQVRITENGKMFQMYKIRSMWHDAEERFAEVQKQNQSDGISFKNENDPRIMGAYGRFIRKTSLDELPQLWNVFKGDMSLIGPRPPLPREVVLYTPHQMERLLVKGGLSCICQVEGRSDMPFEQWVESDIEYVQTRSLKLDIKLFFKTILVVLQRKGAK